jgi:hypothetical protein
VLSVGIFFVVALPCSILGIVFSRRGKKKVEAGKARKHGGLAQAGFVTGVVGTVLGALAAAGWILLLGLGFVTEGDGSSDGLETTPALLVGVLVRLAVRLTV